MSEFLPQTILTIGFDLSDRVIKLIVAVVVAWAFVRIIQAIANGVRRAEKD